MWKLGLANKINVHRSSMHICILEHTHKGKDLCVDIMQEGFYRKIGKEMIGNILKCYNAKRSKSLLLGGSRSSAQTASEDLRPRGRRFPWDLEE